MSTLSIDALEQFVLAKCDSFTNMGLWPAGDKLQPRKWLENFTEDEKEHALYLLNSFVYFNSDLSISLLKATIINLSNKLLPSESITEHDSKWKEFLANSIFIPSVGEERSVTDSATFLAGHLRRDLYIPEYNILSIDRLYDPVYISQIKKYDNVVFFDDFIGSGNQFINMWTNDFEKDGKIYPSTKDQCATMNLSAHYCCMIATEYGVERVKQKAPNVELYYSHILQQNTSPIHENSVIWPHHLRATGPAFIFDVSKRAGIPESQYKGYHGLGLALAFSFTIPDASLPIFYWNNEGWSPLMERS